MKRFKLTTRFKITIVLLALVVVFSIGGGIGYALFFAGGSVNLQKGLVGHWKMDGNAKDASPNGNHGTVTGATLTTDRKGQSNKAYAFNGTSDFIEIADNDIFSFGNGTADSAFSVSVWVYMEASNIVTVISKAVGAAGSNKEWELQPQTNRIMALVLIDSSNGREAYRPTTVASALNGWTHWVATYDGRGGNAAGAGIEIYRDGVNTSGTQSTHADYVAMENKTFPVRIGARGDGAQYFDGNIDDMRIYNRVLSQAEITALYQSYNPGVVVSDLQKGLVGHWKMDGNAKDATPNSNHGTVTGATLTTDRKGQANKAYSFNGTSDYVDVDSAIDDISTQTQGSVSVWFTYPSQAASNRIFSVSDSGDALSMVDIYGATNGKVYIAIFENSAGILYFSTDNTFNDGGWHHAVLTVGSSGNALYVDGVAQAVTYTNGNSATQAWFNSVNDLDSGNIGRRKVSGTGSLYFNGSIDDVRVYNRALSPTEITALYESYNPGVVVSDLQKGLVGHWKFDGNAKDATPNSNHGTLAGPLGANNLPQLTSDRKGQSSKAYDFDGTDDYVAAGNIGNFQSFTVAFWEQYVNTGGGVRAVFMQGEGSWSDSFYFWGANAFWIRLADGTNWVNMNATGATSLDGNWHHIVLVVDRNTDLMSVYDNNSLKNSADISVLTDAIGINAMQIAFSRGDNQYFNGKIDDVRIYNRALSQTEITALYESYR